MAAKDKVYKCLNPRGVEQPEDIFPLAPRLDTIDGKNILLSLAGEPDINIAVEKLLKKNYPNVNWLRKPDTAVPLSDEELKTTDAVVAGTAF